MATLHLSAEHRRRSSKAPLKIQRKSTFRWTKTMRMKMDSKRSKAGFFKKLFEKKTLNICRHCYSQRAEGRVRQAEERRGLDLDFLLNLFDLSQFYNDFIHFFLLFLYYLFSSQTSCFTYGFTVSFGEAFLMK